MLELLEHIKQEKDRIFITKDAYNILYRDTDYQTDFDDKRFTYFFPEDKLYA